MRTHNSTPLISSALSRSFYERDTVQVAQELLGNYLVRIRDNTASIGMIVETEAYQIDDPACHAFKGKTPRTEPLFGPVGHAYIYFIYGTHFCLNVVAKPASLPAGGVLIRALEPVTNISCPTNGPGKLTKALGITCKDRNIDLTTKGNLFIAQGIAVPSCECSATARIGISTGQDRLWRFFITNNKWVSK